MKGKFIVFGGLDQTGKTTQSKRIVQYLNKIGVPAHWTREPKGTELGQKISDLILLNDLSPITQLLLFQSAREEHLRKVIKPKLKQGKWVITDRFFESTFLYQGEMGISDEILLKSHQLIGHDLIKPDLVFLFKGNVGERTKYDKLDLFCNQNKTELENRMKVYKEKTNEKCKIINVNNLKEDEVFNVLKEYLDDIKSN